MTAYRFAVLAVVVGCSKAPQSTAAAPKDAAATTAPTAPTVSIDAAAAVKDKGPKMSDDATIKAYYKQHGWGEPVQIKPIARVPGLYDVEGERKLLVHDGKVVEGGGLAAFTSYVRATKLAPKPPLELGDMIELLAAFDAYPETAAYDRRSHIGGSKYPALEPKLAFDGGGAHLVLHYWVPTPAGPARSVVRVDRWTLDLGNDGKLAWRSEQIQFDKSKS